MLLLLLLRRLRFDNHVAVALLVGYGYMIAYRGQAQRARAVVHRRLVDFNCVLETFVFNLNLWKYWKLEFEFFNIQRLKKKNVVMLLEIRWGQFWPTRRFLASISACQPLARLDSKGERGILCILDIDNRPGLCSLATRKHTCSDRTSETHLEIKNEILLIDVFGRICSCLYTVAN